MRWKQPWKSEARDARGVLLAELKRLRGRISALEQASAASDEAGAVRSEAGEDASPEWFRVIAAHSADIFGELDEEGRLLYLSPNVREITGAEPDEFVGGEALALVHPDDLERAARGIQRARSASSSVTIRYRLKDGSWGWFETVARPYRNRDGEVRIVKDFGIQAPKTKDFADLLGKLDIKGSFLVIPESHQDALWRSSRNIPGSAYRVVDDLNAYEVLKQSVLIFEEAALDKLIERYKNAQG